MQIIITKALCDLSSLMCKTCSIDNLYGKSAHAHLSKCVQDFVHRSTAWAEGLHDQK